VVKTSAENDGDTDPVCRCQCVASVDSAHKAVHSCCCARRQGCGASTKPAKLVILGVVEAFCANTADVGNGKKSQV
jgi:hypothetical protein